MKPKRIILIRHGESEGNVDRAIYNVKPDYALSLSPLGIEQARSAGQRLKNIIGHETVFFYVSPMWRARETFEHIADSIETFKFVEEPRLREQEWGHLRDLAECQQTDDNRDSYGTFYYRIPDGESAADVYDRVSDFFGTMFRDFAKDNYPENVVIVTHGMTIRLFLMRWFHWTVEEFEEYANPENCQIVVMQLQNSIPFNYPSKYALETKLKKRKPKHGYQRPVNLQKFSKSDSWYHNKPQDDEK